MKNSCLFSMVVVLCGIFIGSPVMFKQAFGPMRDTITIDQQIGGELVCDYEYNADLASWFYDVTYTYVPNGKPAVHIGTGEYYGREWMQDEQLVKISSWLVLSVGGGFQGEKLLVGTPRMEKWHESIVSQEEIHGDSLWQAANIRAFTGWLPYEVDIRSMVQDCLEVKYVYRTGDQVGDLDSTYLLYSLDSILGEYEMIGVGSQPALPESK